MIGHGSLDVEVRIATPADAAGIAVVVYESFREFEALYTPEAFAATTPTEQSIRDRMTEGTVWLAIRKDLIVGTVAGVPMDTRFYVRSMAVQPASRGLRIGRLLLEELEVFATMSGCESLFLSTTPFLHAAIRLYERFGFRRTEEEPHDLSGTPLFTMEKNLSDGRGS